MRASVPAGADVDIHWDGAIEAAVFDPTDPAAEKRARAAL